MFLTGILRLEYGQKKAEIPVEKRINYREYTEIQDSLQIKMSRAFKEYSKIKRQQQEKEARIEDEEKRLESIRMEIIAERELLEKRKASLDELMKGNERIEIGKIKKIAKIYEAMKPAEAAPILETLSNELIVKIFSSMSEVDVIGKIKAKFTPERAGDIDKLMAKPPLAQKK